MDKVYDMLQEKFAEEEIDNKEGKTSIILKANDKNATKEESSGGPCGCAKWFWSNKYAIKWLNLTLFN